jgi:hypothetical protein
MVVVDPQELQILKKQTENTTVAGEEKGEGKSGRRWWWSPTARTTTPHA